MTTTVLDLATTALGDIGVLAAGEVPNAGQSAGALARLNALIDQWKAERLQAYTIARATATLTASQASFTVGSGGNVNIARPVYIDRVAYVDTSVTPNLEVSLGQLLTEEEYQAIPQKALTGTRPSAAYYNPTYPLGTLIPWPIPTAASLLWAVYYASPVDEFAAITDPVALPPGYRRMIEKALAVELLPSYQRDATPLLMSQAADAKAVVKRSNERRRDMYFPAESLLQGNATAWDFRTGP